MATNTLSELKIKRAKPKEKDYKLFDGGGLYLLIKTSGAKYWRLKYRFAGKEKNLALGVYSSSDGKHTKEEHVTLSQARALRAANKKMLAKGIDPSIKRKQDALTTIQKMDATFERVGRDWVKLKSNQWTPDHTKDVLRSLELDIFPKLGGIPISEITSPALRAVLEKVQARGTLETTKRLRQRCSAIFRYGQAMGLCDSDPADPLKEVLLSPKKKNLAALSLEEMPEFLNKLAKYNCGRQTRLAMDLMMLTFVRTSELCGARWSEIDFQKAIWNIPKERMKRRRPHFVPLSRQALEVLDELNEMNGHWELVFPKRGKPREEMSNATILRVIERLGYKGRMTGHGFRSLASTALNESQLFHADAIERQLSHEQNDEVRAAYNRAQHIQERVKMMQWWADEVDTMRSQPLAPKRAAL